MTPRIPPKNGSQFNPGQTIRLEFPAQGYINPLNTTLVFDVTLTGYGTPAATDVRFQNCIASIFSRVRLLYGATPLEDIINYNQIVRSLTEWTSTNSGVMDQTSISEGVGGFIVDNGGATAGGVPIYGVCSVRQKYIQGHGLAGPVTAEAVANFSQGAQMGLVGDQNSPVSGLGVTSVTRRYQINFALGMFTQDRLIPAKFMASQLAVETTLADASACIFTNTGAGTNPTYFVSNVNLIPEILQFDASYDSMFLRGLREGGVPLKFSSWHTYIFSSASGANVSLQIQERSRSVKAIFAMQKKASTTFIHDSGATFLDTSDDGLSTLQTYQYRIGGRYFPAAPVQTSQVGGAVCNGASEAYVELSKALNIVGDYRLSASTSAKNWALQTTSTGVLQHFDGMHALTGFDPTGRPTIIADKFEIAANSFLGGLPSACFCAAINLETSNGVEISGLNAEEQSDISLLMNWKKPQKTGATNQPSNIEVYTYYDAMIILRENNVIELIQ